MLQQSLELVQLLARSVGMGDGMLQLRNILRLECFFSVRPERCLTSKLNSLPDVPDVPGAGALSIYIVANLVPGYINLRQAGFLRGMYPASPVKLFGETTI